MSGRGTTDAIFIVRQLQEKHLAANKPLYMAFVDLKKAFDRVPRDVIWWAMRKLGIDEWLVRLVQSMYKDVRSRVRVGDGYSEEFGVGVGVHQGSVLSPLLFIIVLEALSREFRTGCPWELLYADVLMISAESMEELLVKVQTWKTEMEKKGLRVNMGKTKIMESGINLDMLKKSGKYPCGVCQSGVGSSNAIFCGSCKRWVHKKALTFCDRTDDVTYCADVTLFLHATSGGLSLTAAFFWTDFSRFIALNAILDSFSRYITVFLPNTIAPKHADQD